MADADTERASFVSQIVEQTLEALRGQESFDEEAIRRVAALASTGGLRTWESVVRALVGGEEE